MRRSRGPCAPDRANNSPRSNTLPAAPPCRRNPPGTGCRSGRCIASPVSENSALASFMPLLAIISRQIVERLGALRALIEGGQRLAQEAALVAEIRAGSAPVAAGRTTPPRPSRPSPPAWRRSRGLFGLSGVAVAIGRDRTSSDGYPARFLRPSLSSLMSRSNLSTRFDAAGMVLVPDPLQLLPPPPGTSRYSWVTPR